MQDRTTITVRVGDKTYEFVHAPELAQGTDPTVLGEQILGAIAELQSASAREAMTQDAEQLGWGY